MKLIAFYIVTLSFVLTLFPNQVSAHDETPTESALYSDPLVWATVGAAAIFSYTAGARFVVGAKNVLPALLTSTVFIGTTVSAFVLRKFAGPVVGALLPALGIAVLLIYKSLLVCPVKGTQGCCCHLNPSA